MLKKTVPFIIAAALAASLTACSADYSGIEGYSEIENARKLYSELFSAHLTITDCEKDILTQELTFMYDTQDRLVYSYYGTDGSTQYFEYHNGFEYSYTDGGEWKTVTEGGENYHSYSKSAKMSMTDAGMIFIKPESITSSAVTQDGENKVIKTQYDAAALNSSMSSQLGLVGSLKSFEVIYTLDKDGYCVTMEQIGVAEQDGKESKVDYLLKIDKMNDVAEIVKPDTEAYRIDGEMRAAISKIPRHSRKVNNKGKN